MEVKVTTFKRTGKYYTDVTITLPDGWKQMIEHVRLLIWNGNIPGIEPGPNQDFFVLVEPQDDEDGFNVPALLNVERREVQP